MTPAPRENLNKQSLAQNCWSFLHMIFGGGVSLTTAPVREAMFKLELTQMAQRVAEVESAVSDALAEADEDANISGAARRRYLEAALDGGNPSGPLKAELEKLLGKSPATSAPATPPAGRQIKRKPATLPPPSRRLRVYALDPVIGKSLLTTDFNETLLSLDWEEVTPGPVGEYLEVVDVDPASNRLYDPVNLDEPKLLAQDGWPPSEGNPQFHQQMVYAVAMTIIGRFEKALGRKVIWAPRYGECMNASGKMERAFFEVPRLRLYPHALRTSNAYYSPDKKALLFGYFQAAPRSGDVTASGSMVFSCLSSDIIAHEMTHALLDGLHRRFMEASNPDVLAFHEGFADIIALFHHFTIPELVRFQIAQARGKLSAAGLLGGLARQFGEAVQRGGPLRDYLGEEVRSLSYSTTFEVHARGSILVAAVFEAFLKIVAHRTADLIRLATNGTGVLPEGALHPDLVNRLTDEACTVAGHVMRMCIRALDYCPAVDITFGEFLRALITADIDMVPKDVHHYRVAFMEAFRARDLLPHDVRTISEESLAWQTLDDPRPAWLDKALDKLNLGWDLDIGRSEIFQLHEKNRWCLWNVLKEAFIKDPDLCAQFGIQSGVPSYRVDEQGILVETPKDKGTTFDVFSVRPARRMTPDGSFRTELVAAILQQRPVDIDPGNKGAGQFWFRGGVTLIIDPRKEHREVRYGIVKNIASERRIDIQRRTFSARAVSPLRSLYFGSMSLSRVAKDAKDTERTIKEPFAQLHADEAGGDND